MQCYKCGSVISDNSLVCSKCGAEMSVFARRTYQTGVDTNPFTSHLPMNWYKFLIIVSIFATSVTSFISGILYVTGYIYNVQFVESLNAYTVYMQYGTGFMMADIIYGLLSMLYAVFGFVVRSKLANFKKNAPMYLYAWYIMGLMVNIGYSICTYAFNVAHVSYLMAQIPSFIFEMVLIYLNYIYFSKRKHFFVN